VIGNPIEKLYVRNESPKGQNDVIFLSSIIYFFKNQNPPYIFNVAGPTHKKVLFFVCAASEKGLKK